MGTKRSSKHPHSNSPASAQSSGTVSPAQDDLFPIVGIGASAGGLEAFTQLLSHLQTDTGMAFVLVQHLDPNQKSLLSEILSRTTQMPVREVQDGTVVEPNRFYTIPPNTTMTIAQGMLRLSVRDKTRKVSKSIDAFFCSLAADRGSKSIGVVLSGADFDGSEGLQAIKAVGGITFAQSQDSAQVAIMPNSAIATGQVDFILPPAEIAKKLVDISRHPYLAGSAADVDLKLEPSDEKAALSAIFSLLRAATRVDFTHYKQTTIKRRILRRMALYRLEHLHDYLHYLQENSTEVQALYQEILIKVTSFFREPEAFEALNQKVFPTLLQNRAQDSPIRIWVAGCSTGEEAYSIAIGLIEFLADHRRNHQPIQIFATDVNELAIDQARLGIYAQSQVADISADRLQRFFTPVEGSYQINKAVRELCIFARHNLVSDPPFSRLDLISCRNVFIYFGASLQRKVLPMLHYGLLPSGFLLLGTSEMVGEWPNLFTLFDRKSKIYAKQPSFLPLNLDLMVNDYPVAFTEPQPYVGETSQNEMELQKIADRIVLQQYAPVGVVVNAQLEILQFRGQTGAYLEPSPGRASLKLLSMAKEELRLDLRTAIHQAKQDGQISTKEGIALREIVRTDDDSSIRTRLIRIDVIPFKPAAMRDYYFLVLFKDMPSPPTVEAEPRTNRRTQSKRTQASAEQQEIQRLQQELSTTKAYLQSIIEEQQSTNQDLRAANEEILSSNEELQSTNEELQTAKEEIQATNEELSTINDELYRRNAETAQVSSDLQNLLDSVDLPILMLEGDLRIRRFTATAAPLFNLIATDIGRPFSNIKHNLNLIDLDRLILEVINTLTPYSREVQDLSGQWYDLRIRPYRTLDNRIDGAVAMLVDIDDTLKRRAETVRDARDYAEAIVQTVRESLVVLNEDLLVTTANQAFYDTFQVSKNETETCRIFDLGNGQWNIPRLRLLLENLLTQNTQIQDFEVEHNFERIGRKIMLLNARKMSLLEGRELILLAIEDISDHPR